MLTVIKNSHSKIQALPRLLSLSRMYSSSNDAPEIEFKKVNQIGSITLNRPKQLNALNLSMVKLMHKQLDEYEADKDVKAIVIKGSGDSAFCAGGKYSNIWNPTSSLS